MSEALARIRTGAELDAMTFPPLAWAVPGLVPEGFGLLTGPPKAGKSWLVLDIALGVAAGGRVLGKVGVGRPRPVLYFALEDGERRLQDRARTLLGPGEPIPSRLHYLTEASPAEVLDVIDAWLDRHGHAQPLIILDTLGRIMPPALPGEGAYQRDYRVGGRLKRAIDAHPGAALLVVHHTRKAGAEDWMDSTSGTNGLNGSADFTVSLSRARGETAGVLRATGRDVPEGEYALTMTSGLWQLDGAALADAARKVVQLRAAEGLGDQSTEILATVNEHPEGIGPTEVARTLGMTANKAGVYLARLADAGRVHKAARGSYKPLTTPVETVESVESEDLLDLDSTLSTVSTATQGHDEQRCPTCSRRLGRAESVAGVCTACSRIAAAGDPS